MQPQLHFEPLHVDHLQELASVLLHPAVYEHIDDRIPTLAEFKLGLQRAIAGPRPDIRDETWLNFLVRDAEGAMLGRLEATVHHNLAEVAFLFGPRHWGRGLASAALPWLHAELCLRFGITEFWATTVPANVRCQRLLRRCGYELAQPPQSPLYSFDHGDLVFHRRSAA